MSTTITYSQFTDGVFGDKLRLAFPFDRDTIDGIKTIPGKFYDPSSKTWSIPVDQLDALRDVLPTASFVESGLQPPVPRDLALVASTAQQAATTAPPLGVQIAAKLRELAALVEGIR